MKNYLPTEDGFKGWEENYEDGDVIAVQSIEFWNFKDNLIQWGTGNKFPDKKRFCHVEPVLDSKTGLSIRANGDEVVRANVDDYRTMVFEKKRRLVIFRAMPRKNNKQLNQQYKPTLMMLLYKDYDKKQIWGFITTNLTNFWKWLTRQKEIENTKGSELPICSTVCLLPDRAAGYKICEGMNTENVNPTNLCADPTYEAIAEIG